MEIVNIWPKNMEKYYETGGHLILGVGLMPGEKIALEIGTTGQIRLGLMVDMKSNTIAHNCPAATQYMPCWHLAAGLDASMFVRGKKLYVPGTCPVAQMWVDTQTVRAGQVIIRDLTKDYLLSRGFEARDGDFKLFILQEEPEPVKVQPAPPAKGIFSRLIHAAAVFLGVM